MAFPPAGSAPSGEERVDDEWVPGRRSGRLMWQMATSSQFKGTEDAMKRGTGVLPREGSEARKPEGDEGWPRRASEAGNRQPGRDELGVAGDGRWDVAPLRDPSDRPWPLCRCAQALLEHGASVHGASGTGGDTPLHVAAQRGLDEHVRLYLNRGARVDARNGRGETALSAACGAVRRPDEHARCLRLCTLLLRRGAAVDARDEDERSPLHKACGHARHDLARLLLRHGADAGALDYGGASPLARALQTAACAPQAAPQRTVQALLNHGSPTVWPDAFPKRFPISAGLVHQPITWKQDPPTAPPVHTVFALNQDAHFNSHRMNLHED
ncbi:hypothetical protein HPG69_010733 [Diceros bicornis minor]|uniref:Uncharacterized protein n=1 Tax=Diceros bicornis minor TaxID=77932 RepID=A0A7J7EUF9_DICBM|nr:hypothetical protein HPG69_010733 [Diceros bicornis minor]